jgi:uncharacterized membrane protein YgcG
MPALDASIGGPNSDSYVTLAYADAFFAAHYSLVKAAVWAALTIPQKESALRRGTQILDGLRVLDSEYGYGAMPYALVLEHNWDVTIHRQLINQRLQFPRNIDTDEFGTPIIPVNVQDADCEQAIHLLTFDEATIASQMLGIKSESVGVGTVKISQVFGGSGGSSGGGGGFSAIAPLALELMREFLRSTRRVQRA